MLKRAYPSLKAARAAHPARHTHSSAASRGASRARAVAVLTTSSAVLTAAALWLSTPSVIHNDAPTGVKSIPERRTLPGADLDLEDELYGVAWGSNKNHVVLLEKGAPETIRTPAVVDWLKDVALRDLALHECHAACVDAKGDVYQWGDGFDKEAGSSTGKPKLTLSGKNIVRVQVTPTRVFALSSSGHLYTLSSSAAKNVPDTPTSSSWTGWLWGRPQGVDFAEIIANEKLGWGEKFIAIAAGTDHLLALTSAGRTFALPITLNANTYGQLGFRNFDVPAFNTLVKPGGSDRVSVELTPKSVVDPYAKATPAIRRASAAAESGRTQASNPVVPVDDSSIRFSDKLFEIPALRGVHVSSIAAGGRTSFVKTSNGKVLGWGANEFGQIGLGSQVTLDTITVPTEVILWRSTPSTMRSSCLDVYAGGDLTLFKVERADSLADASYVDVLVCGNGQWGGLGNALYSSAQSTPSKARNVSGLLEYSEDTKKLEPIVPDQISVSPTGHVLLTLDTQSHSGPRGGGRDILAWGANTDYQLGNGKRGSVAMPTMMNMPSGGRFMLVKKKATLVRDMNGGVWKKGVEVEQRPVAGWGNSFVYWRICSP